VELRMACQQPWRHHMCVAALNLGIVEGHKELAQLLQDQWGPCDFAMMWEKLRQAGAESTRVGLHTPEWQRLIATALQVCDAQLRKRGMGEEVYLEPLFYRENPGRKYAAYFKLHGLEEFIKLVSVNQFFE